MAVGAHLVDFGVELLDQTLVVDALSFEVAELEFLAVSAELGCESVAF